MKRYEIDGSIERHQAQLTCFRGNNQLEQEDFHETFAPLAKTDEARLHANDGNHTRRLLHNA